MSSTAPALTPSPVPRRARDKKTEHHARNIQIITASYLVDGLVLMLFHLAGTIGWTPVVAYTLAGMVLCGVTYALIASGWTQRFQDPGIVIPHTIAAQGLQLAAMVLFPEVGFMFALLLFIVYCTLTLSVQVRHSVLAWVIVSLASGAVLTQTGSQVRIPDQSLTEQLIAYGFFVVTVWRCVWIGSFNSGMTRMLKQRGRELAALTEQVDQLAHRDELTGVMNRRSLLETLRDEIQRSERSHLSLCVGILDLDKFKTINDTHGHLAGDRTLKIFASTLARHTRKSDRFGRYGGEEFLLVMTGTDTSMAPVPIERMRDALKTADWSEVGPGVNVTFSCGIAELRPGDSLEGLVQRADDALYRAKADGRNCTRLG